MSDFMSSCAFSQQISQIAFSTVSLAKSIFFSFSCSVHYYTPLKAKFNYLSFEGLSALLKMPSALKTGQPLTFGRRCRGTISEFDLMEF